MKMESRGRGSLLTGIVCLGLLATGAPAQNQTLAERIAAGQERAQATKQFLEDLLTKAQAEHQARRAAMPPPQVDPQAAEAAAEAKRAFIVQEIIPWLHTDEHAPDGTPVDQAAAETLRQTKLQNLGQQLQQREEAQRQAVEQFLKTNPLGWPRSWRDDDGKLHLIDRIDERGVPRAKEGFNAGSADTVRADDLWPGGSTGMSLTGTNLSIGLWDQGDVRITHREFSTNGVRVVDIDGPSTNGIDLHATHVAGTLGAWGVSTNARGFSHRGKILAADFISDRTEITQSLTTNTYRTSNHSYGYPGGWEYSALDQAWIWLGDESLSQSEDWFYGWYDSVAQETDQIVYDAETFLPVWAIGNEGAEAPSSQPVMHWTYTNGIGHWSTTIRPADGGTGGYDDLNTYAVAKNNLVVGAVNKIAGGYSGTNSVVLAGFSSCGPTDDGRIKPDLVAAGVDLFSTSTNTTSSYTNMSGTSMAAPSVTGTLGLLTELHQRFYGTNQPMLASTLKGLVLHTADEAGASPGPDYRHGWGLLNAVAAARLVTNNHYSQSLAHIKEVRLVSGDYIEFPVVVSAGAALKASTVWTDPAGTPAGVSLDPTNRMLVNDLDLRVIQGTNTYFPWRLNRNNPTNAATTGDNIRDNVEQVVITNAAAGTYLVRITHKGSLVDDAGQTNAQRVSVLISGNVAQAPVQPAFTQITLISTNSIVLKWAADVGRVYMVQHRRYVETGTWQDSTGEISATKTNVTVALTKPAASTRFYRLVQLR